MLSKKEIDYYQQSMMYNLRTTFDTVIGGLFNECERNRKLIEELKAAIEQITNERDAWQARTEGASRVITKLNEMME